MYLNQNALQYKHYQDFVKYAQFICEKFDIQIELDATRAETDGRTIFLPNVLSMTEAELNMLYAVLLHEAGHIRYSTFSDSYFLQLHTKNHAFLANCIEDARIENLLLNDFGGAKDMLEELYCNHTKDKNLMKKVFKHEGDKPDLFNAVGFYVHNKIVNFKTASLQEICGTRMANRIRKFWSDENIDSIIAKNNLKNDSDVIALTNEIYKLFIDYFKTKDSSEKLDFAKQISEKKEIEKTLADLRKKAKKVQEQIDELRSEAAQINQKIDFQKQLDQSQVEPLVAQLKDLKNQSTQLEEKIDWKKSFDQSQKTISTAPQLLANLENELQKQQAEKLRLEEQLKSGLNGRKKELTQEQKDAITAKIDTKKRQEERYAQKINDAKNALDQAQKDFEQALQYKQNNPAKFNDSIDIAQLQEELSQNEKLSAEIKQKLDAMKAQQQDLQKELAAITEKEKKIQSDFVIEASEAMFALDSLGQNANIALDVLPELNYQDAWPEAAQAQDAFDKKASTTAGKMVRNGAKGAGLFGSNVRDVVTFIDKSQFKVQQIDVHELFKNKVQPSKLKDMNSDCKILNYREDKSVLGTFGTHRDHIPLTTEFDSIKKQNHNPNIQELGKIVQDNAVFFKSLKNVFSKKLKFAKKDFWRGAQEEGTLDTRNLWKIPTKQGNDFYEVSNPKFINKLAATILVDVSGSQNKDATEYGKKIQTLVLAISQALDAVHVKHEILGYHAPVCPEMRSQNASSIYTRRSNRLETIVYKEAAQKDASGILNIEPQMSDNSDGESLRIAIKRLKAIRAKSHMIFVISDGKPFLCDTDMSVLDEDLRSAMRYAVREKVQIFGVGFFEQLREFFAERFCNANDLMNVPAFFDKSTF